MRERFDSRRDLLLLRRDDVEVDLRRLPCVRLSAFLSLDEDASELGDDVLSFLSALAPS